MDAAQTSQAVGFSIATNELSGYVRHTRQLVEELHRLASHRIRSVREIADDSFGRIGKETGFSAALNHFAGALEHQVGGIAGNADKVGDGVAKTVRAYRDQDADLAQDLLSLLDRGMSGK